jgi:MYXO-CTERM domain-containing protein
MLFTANLFARHIVMSLCGALLLSSPVLAETVTWTLEDVSYPSGGVVNGSFTIDTNTAALSAIDVTSTADGSFSGGTYLYQNPSDSLSFYEFVLDSSNAADLTGTPAIIIEFNSSLAVPGTDTVLDVSEGSCFDANCDAFGNSRFEDTTGIATTATPEPASLALALLGVGLLELRRRCVSRSV